jgi:hypothetical protein
MARSYPALSAPRPDERRRCQQHNKKCDAQRGSDENKVMLICERTWQAEMSGSSGARDDRERSVAAHEGEQAEDRQSQRYGTHGTDQACEPNTRLPPQRATDGDVDEERVELSVGPSRVQRFKPFFKLIPAEPPLGRGVP